MWQCSFLTTCEAIQVISRLAVWKALDYIRTCLPSLPILPVLMGCKRCGLGLGINVLRVLNLPLLQLQLLFTKNHLFSFSLLVSEWKLKTMKHLPVHVTRKLLIEVSRQKPQVWHFASLALVPSLLLLQSRVEPRGICTSWLAFSAYFLEATASSYWSVMAKSGALCTG